MPGVQSTTRRLLTEQAGIDRYLPLTQRGAANGVATLGADGRLPAGQAPIASQVLTAYKTAGTDRANTITPADDPHLALASVPVGTWLADGLLLHTSAVSTADITLKLLTGTAVLGNGGGFADIWTNTAMTADPSNTAPLRTLLANAAALAAARVAPLIAAVVTSTSFTATVEVTTAGSLAVQWAQGTAGATASTLMRGSYLRLSRIA